jgi:predicted SnoaL-like aldol condensation-catalyzing enzyme
MSSITRAAALFLLTIGLLSAQTPDAAKLDANKKLLVEFFRLGADRDARTQMLTNDYTQHNPRFLKMDEVTHLKGREAWGGAANLRSTPVAIVAEGDYVVAIYKATLTDPDNPAKTYEAFNFEMVRIKDGKLAEHWDAVKLAKGWKTELDKAAPAK